MKAAEKLCESTTVSAACESLGVPRSSFYRARQPKREPKPRPTPERALSQGEREQVRQTLNSERFQDSAPRQVYAALLDEADPEDPALEPGPIEDEEGHVLGRHRGIARYTVGQRRGLGISAPEPLYVLAIEPAANTLVVGTADELGRDECTVAEMHYISGETPTAPFRAWAQIRYRARPVGVTITPLPEGRAHVRFDAPQRDITPGQFLVLYHGETVLGGGVICTAPEFML